MNIPNFVSHISDDGRFESVETHLNEVSEMAEAFGEPWGLGKLARCLGLSHDIGKYSSQFQHRILDNGPKVDHSTAGAYELFKHGLWPLSYCVAGHHGGLPDGGTKGDLEGTLVGRLSKAADGQIPDYNACDLNINEVMSPEMVGVAPDIFDETASQEFQFFSFSFMIRMLFSCLVDADFLCTERFMRGKPRDPVPHESLSILKDRFEERITKFFPPHGQLNKLRCLVLNDCLRLAQHSQGFFSLTVPTGGGKTLSGMRFALSHACKYDMKRIIIAEPYTSIIEQNSQVYRDYLDTENSENVLEHHSSFDFDSYDEDPLRKNLRLAAENWDMPIVVTTNVQLFESLFASSTSKCRKLHNIAGSVIVLDESQMIPTQYLRSCIRVLVELVKNYKCSVVLCTATQPALDGFFKDYGYEVTEIVSDKKNLFGSLKRVTYSSIGELSDDELVSRLADYEQVLCILNNRKQTRAIYNELTELFPDAGVYHLSTLMYPEHRQKILEIVRIRLKEGLPCRLIATNLVEAGVDLDFPTVYRSLAGLDSLVQAAGRCNREGLHKPSSSIVYLFFLAVNSETGRKYALPPEIKQRAGVTETVLPELLRENKSVEVGSLRNIKNFFETLYAVKESSSDFNDKFDKNRVLELLSSCYSETIGLDQTKNQGQILSIDFKTASSKFSLIENKSKSIIIPVEAIQVEIEAMLDGCATRKDIRHIGRYCVSAYPQDVRALINAGAIKPISDDLYLLEDMTRYSSDKGLDLNTTQGEGLCW
jgi:CRISPR-associated endonuclease/helicase Cas3